MKLSPPNEPLLDCAAAAAVLGGLHPKTVERWAREGRIPAYHYFRHWKFRASELEVWIVCHVNSGLPSVPLKTGEIGWSISGNGFRFGWLDLKKRRNGPEGLGPALQGNLSGRLKTHAEFNRWINRRISDRVTGTHGKHVPLAFNQSGETRWSSYTVRRVVERYLAQELPERNSTASRYRSWLENYIKPK